MKFKGRLLKKHVKVTKKLKKNRCKFTIKKNAQKSAQKSDFGRCWAHFGKGLGRSGQPCGHFWAHFDVFFGFSKSYLVKALVQDGPQEAFWMDFGSLWKGFGTV